MWFYSSSLYSSVPDILQVIWCVSSGKVNQLLSWSASSLIHKKSALFESKSAVQLLWQLDFKRKCTVLRGICLIPKQILHPSCPGRNDFKSVSCKMQRLPAEHLSTAPTGSTERMIPVFQRGELLPGSPL